MIGLLVLAAAAALMLTLLIHRALRRGRLAQRGFMRAPSAWTDRPAGCPAGRLWCAVAVRRSVSLRRRGYRRLAPGPAG